MRGFVPTPEHVVDLMVASLFNGKEPSRDSAILDPGCGPGAFIDGIIRWCARHGCELPEIVGVEQHPGRAGEARAKFHGHKSITILQQDFLRAGHQRFDFVIGNPPYVSIGHIAQAEKARFRAEYEAARGRFDLYMLFFEQGLRLLTEGGRLVFITPEKFLYVKTAEPLRRILARVHVEEIRLTDEATFGKLVTYPTITTVLNKRAHGTTKVFGRDGTARRIEIPADGASLLPLLMGQSAPRLSGGPTLEDICLRISCGVATGADSVFVRETASLDSGLRRFAFPTVSGRQLVPGQQDVRSKESMLIPYDSGGRLLALHDLEALGNYLVQPAQKSRLTRRTCAERKPWYAFHDSVPIQQILLPKILCKDIAAEPSFWLDRQGALVPRHSVYYLVPKDASQLDEIAAWLNSPEALRWLRENCQRASNGFIRLQSATLKRLPVPEWLVKTASARPVKATSHKVVRARHAALVLSR